jgi:PhnB protein
VVGQPFKEETTMSAVSYIPDGYHTVTPHLAVRNAAKALEFYAKAFGAEELFRMPGPGGVIMHAEVRIGDSNIMLGEEDPQRGATSPQTIGGSPVGLLIYVKDVDASFARAEKAGCTVQMPPTDMFWGDRYGKLVDPFGHHWSLATHKEDVSPEDMAKRMAAMA